MFTKPIKRILVTGATGFLGNVVCQELASKGYELIRLGRSVGNDIVCDLSTAIPEITESIDFIVHSAGKAHSVPRTESERREFFNTNVAGTRNLLEGLNRTESIQGFVFISSIAVYGLTHGENISETQPLQAADPYGKSKIESEYLLTEWSQNYNVPLAVLRLPLIAGNEPPGNLGAMIRGIRKGYYFGIGNSEARKSIVMAEDVANIIPSLAEHPGIYHLTDGYHPSFRELEREISKQLGKRMPLAIPLPFARFIGKAGDIVNTFLKQKFPLTSSGVEKITSTLTFDDQKARKILNWRPQKVLDVFRIV